MRCHTTLAVGMNSISFAKPSRSVTWNTPRSPVSLISRPWMQPENAMRGSSNEG